MGDAPTTPLPPRLGERGSVAVITAIVLLALLGFAGLGTDITFALYKHRQMQSIAGAAAMGGATAMMTGHPASPATEARAIAASVRVPLAVLPFACR